jgi:cellulase
VYFNLPTCVASGQYLLRVEVLALHSASKQGQAQFYQSCAQINVSGSGSFSPSNTVTFPGAYSASDPGILASIYGKTGQPDNDGKPYTAPGPKPISC